MEGSLPGDASGTRPEHNAVKLSTALAAGKGIVLDGASATYLETLGADISSALWSASLLQTNPALIQQTHSAYFSHGSQVATTTSYQATFPGLTKHLSITESDAADLVRKSVLLAQKARDDYLSASNLPAKDSTRDALWIAGSVGPYGAYLANGSEYTGDYTLTESQYKDFHRGRIAALVDAGVDVLAVETIPNFAEAQALLALLDTEFPTVESWFAFTVQTSDPTRLPDGTPLATVMSLFEGPAAANVVAVGVNCVPPELALAGLRAMRAASTSRPFIVYANSGEKWDAQKRDWEGEKSGGNELEKWVAEAWELGTRIIGGCCRTGPADMAVVAGALEVLGSKTG